MEDAVGIAASTRMSRRTMKLAKLLMAVKENLSHRFRDAHSSTDDNVSNLFCRRAPRNKAALLSPVCGNDDDLGITQCVCVCHIHLDTVDNG